jgi:hypothetical protein
MNEANQSSPYDHQAAIEPYLKKDGKLISWHFTEFDAFDDFKPGEAVYMVRWSGDLTKQDGRPNLTLIGYADHEIKKGEHVWLDYPSMRMMATPMRSPTEDD